MAATDVPTAEDEGRPPWTVLAYLPVVVVWTIAFRVSAGQDFPIVPTIVALTIDGAIAYGMYRGRKAAWTIALVLMALPVLGLPNAFARDGLDSGLLQSAGVVGLLYLLLHPMTRAWCSHVRPPMERPGATGRPNNVESAVTEQGRRWDRH